jgi:hypothetical protein
MLKGAKNISLYTKIYKLQKFVMTLPLIKLLGHEIASSNWDPASKLVFGQHAAQLFSDLFAYVRFYPNPKKLNPKP